MPIPPAQPSSTFGTDSSVQRRPARPRRAERLALAALAVACVAGLAAWQGPALMDWSRYKGAIAHYATARLGRRVTIGGTVRLTLLPRATLTADAVTLADRGDGVSATLGTMRLEVSLGALLAGRVVPLALTLDKPSATLPWPLPRGAAPGMRPTVAEGFAATMQGGTLRLGGMVLHDIAATLHTDPDTGAFSAQGSAVIAGLPWRFTALVGAPGLDGVSALTLTLDGQAPYGRAGAGPSMQGTGGALRGRILANGAIDGQLALRGPDLSRLGPAPALAWQVQGPVQGNGTVLRAPALSLMLGNAPGKAQAVLHLAAPAALDLQARLGQVALGGWAWRLLQAGPALAAQLPAQLDLSAPAATAGGGTITAPHLVLALGPQGARITAASATLPGGATVQLAGGLAPGGFTGHGALSAPDLRRTLAWLTGGATAALPPAVLARAELQAEVALSAGRVALSGLGGQLDGAGIGGTAAWDFDGRPALALDVTLDRLDPAAWAGLAWPPGAALSPGLWARAFAGFDADWRVQAADASLPALPLHHAVLEGHGGRDGLVLRRVAADLPGGHAEASGTIGPEGGLADARLDIAAPDASALPAAWRVPAKLWQGGFHLALNGGGPADDVAAEIRADLGDLRAEAEAHLDEGARRLKAVVTLRHPGAPRLLDALGVPGAESWLDHGSLAVVAHLLAWPGHVRAEDFSVAAAALHAGGALEADFTGAVPAVRGRIDADTLALPGLAPRDQAALPWGALAGWQGDIAVQAAQLLAGLRPVATQASARILAGGGVAVIEDAQAELAGGHATARAALDATQDPPMAAAQLAIQGVPAADVAMPGLALSGGTIGLSADVAARGYSPAALLSTASGPVQAAVQDAALQGIDLPGMAALLAARGPRLKAALQAAMATGATGKLSGACGLSAADGALHLSACGLAGPAGKVALAGSWDVPWSAMDLLVCLTPAVPAGPTVSLRLAGPAASPRRMADVAPALAWAGQLRGARRDTRRAAKR